jgi:hypothetical protein
LGRPFSRADGLDTLVAQVAPDAPDASDTVGFRFNSDRYIVLRTHGPKNCFNTRTPPRSCLLSTSFQLNKSVTYKSFVFVTVTYRSVGSDGPTRSKRGKNHLCSLPLSQCCLIFTNDLFTLFAL